MTALSDRFTITAKNLIRKYGAEATLSRTSIGTFDPETQTTSATTITSDVVKVIIDNYRAYEIGGPIQYGDKKITLSISDLVNLSEPEPGDIIVINEVTYRVISVDGVSAGDAIVSYVLQVRR